MDSIGLETISVDDESMSIKIEANFQLRYTTAHSTAHDHAIQLLSTWRIQSLTMFEFRELSVIIVVTDVDISIGVFSRTVFGVQDLHWEAGD